MCVKIEILYHFLCHVKKNKLNLIYKAFKKLYLKRMDENWKLYFNISWKIEKYLIDMLIKKEYVIGKIYTFINVYIKYKIVI